MNTVGITVLYCTACTLYVCVIDHHAEKKVVLTIEPYTLKPKRTKIRSKYEFSKGLHTVLHHSQTIVLKHFIHVEKKRDDYIINYKIVREMDIIFYL